MQTTTGTGSHHPPSVWDAWDEEHAFDRELARRDRDDVNWRRGGWVVFILSGVLTGWLIVWLVT